MEQAGRRIGSDRERIRSQKCAPEFFAWSGSKPTDVPVPLFGRQYAPRDFWEWQKMADAVAESAGKRAKKEGDVPTRLKSYAEDDMCGFGLYTPYICAWVEGEGWITESPKRAAIDQKILMVKKGRRIPLKLRMRRAMDSFNMGSPDISIAAGNCLLLAAFRSWPVGKLEMFTTIGAEVGKSGGGIRLICWNSRILADNKFYVWKAGTAWSLAEAEWPLWRSC